MNRRALLGLLGLAMILAGLLWAGQGAGLLAWPAGSPMLGATGWVWGGLALAAAGVAVVAASRR